MSRTEYSVGLVVVSGAATLDQLASLLGVLPGEGSHNAGDPRLPATAAGGVVWADTALKLWSRRDQGEDLEAHFVDLAEQLPAEALHSSGVVSQGAEVYLSVGVFSNATIPTATLSRKCLAISAAYEASTEVCMYTPSFD